MALNMNDTSCPICQGELEPRVLGKASLGGDTSFDLVECQTCLTRYLSPLPSSQQLQEVYLPNYYGSDWYKQRGWGGAFAKLELAKKAQGKFLDVGCGLGFFIDGIKQHSNWEVYGVEFSQKAADFAREELGLNVRQGELVDVNFPDAFFDYIQIHNVLEHVRDPMTLLKECRRILKADGVLDLRVPNGRVDSLDLLQFYRGEGEVPFSKSGHVFFFPPQALLRMFEEIGLQVEQSRTYGIRRGLASLGAWPRLSNWKRHYVPRPHEESDGNSAIALPPNKNRPDLYYTYRLVRMKLRMLPGLREFGLDFEIILRRKASSGLGSQQNLKEASPGYSSVLKLALQKARYSLRGRFSHSNEEYLISKFVGELLPEAGSRTVVDIGAGNGVRWSNSYALLKRGWRVLGVEGDPDKYKLLSRVYRKFPRAHASQARVTLENIQPLLQDFDIEHDFAVLCLDIDGNDYWILDAILSAFRPTLIVTEINEKIPPPIRFAVKYDADFSLRHHFYGYSIATLSDLCARHGYGILQLEYNNAFIAPREIGKDRFIDAETAYSQGYRDRADRKERFPLNFDMEALLSMNSEEALEFLRQFYARETGKYYLGLQPDSVPAKHG